jgi:hypothetical protein
MESKALLLDAFGRIRETAARITGSMPTKSRIFRQLVRARRRACIAAGQMPGRSKPGAGSGTGAE